MSSRRPPSSIPPFERGTATGRRARSAIRERVPTAGEGRPRAPQGRRQAGQGLTDVHQSSRLAGALDAALGGGPQRHHEKVAEQGKLPVRERVERLVDPESFAEEALLANWDQEGLGADGVVTGLALVGGRKVALMANDPTVKAGSGAEDGREDPPHPGARDPARASAHTSLTRRERGSPNRFRCSPAAAGRGGSSTTRSSSRDGCRKFASCLARARRAAHTSRPSATS